MTLKIASFFSGIGGRTLPEGTTPTGMTPEGKKRQVDLQQFVRWYPTPASPWPTPTAGDSRGARNRTSGRQPGSRHHDGMTLTDAVRFGNSSTPRNPSDPMVRRRWATPQASDSRGSAGRAPFGASGRRSQLTDRSQVGGQLNPTWVEWLMGFPLGWTACDASETPSSRKSRKSSGGG